MESTMFVQVTDEGVSNGITAEMLRVAKPNGHLTLIDRRYGKPGNPDYLALRTNALKRMFSVDTSSEIVCQTSGALIPPLGRPISRFLPSVYLILRAVLPLLAGLRTTLLRKRACCAPRATGTVP